MENVTEIIKSGEYEKLHILTHAFWYNEVEKDIKTSIEEYIDSAALDRYNSFKDNITDLDSILE